MKKKFFDKWELNQIFSLAKINQYEAKIKYEEYLSMFPKDYSVYPYYATSLINLGDFEKAEKVLNYVEQMICNDAYYSNNYDKRNAVEKNIFDNRIKLLSYQEKYEELYELVLNSPYVIVDIMDFYCKAKFGMIDPDKRSSYSYIYRQILRYDENDFLYHVRKHMADYNINADIPNSVIFSPNFPIMDVIQEAKKYIPSEKKLCIGFFQNIYIFKYNECGRQDNKLVDYFRVVCFNNTSDFITMYPSSEPQDMPCIDLNYLIKRDDNENAKTKKLNRIDRFNQRYGSTK